MTTKPFLNFIPSEGIENGYLVTVTHGESDESADLGIIHPAQAILPLNPEEDFWVFRPVIATGGMKSLCVNIRLQSKTFEEVQKEIGAMFSRIRQSLPILLSTAVEKKPKEEAANINAEIKLELLRQQYDTVYQMLDRVVRAAHYVKKVRHMRMEPLPAIFWETIEQAKKLGVGGGNEEDQHGPPDESEISS